MNRALIDKLADAVLFEGYILYPYRPSVKNRQRWTFGSLFPQEYVGEASSNRTQCLIQGGPTTAVEAVVRFLHLTNRQVVRFDPPLTDWDEAAAGTPVESIRIDGRLFQSWQEAVVREVAIAPCELQSLGCESLRTFAFAGSRAFEPLRSEAGLIPAAFVREQQPVVGSIALSASPLRDRVFRLTVDVQNRCSDREPTNRDWALLRSLNSAHVLLGAQAGQFTSSTDPPEELRDLAGECRNVGLWPVLVGGEAEANLMLGAPIILPDYPRLAAESPGDLFDGTEIDEILSLRILTLTDEEKAQVAATDERARQLLERTTSLEAERLFDLHGMMR